VERLGNSAVLNLTSLYRSVQLDLYKQFIAPGRGNKPGVSQSSQQDLYLVQNLSWNSNVLTRFCERSWPERKAYKREGKKEDED